MMYPKLLWTLWGEKFTGCPRPTAAYTAPISIQVPTSRFFLVALEALLSVLQFLNKDLQGGAVRRVCWVTNY